MDNIIEFPVSERIREESRKAKFNFHGERINKLLHELAYEFFRAYENPELEDEEFRSNSYIGVAKDGQRRKMSFVVKKEYYAERPDFDLF